MTTMSNERKLHTTPKLYFIHRRHPTAFLHSLPQKKKNLFESKWVPKEGRKEWERLDWNEDRRLAMG